LEGSQRGKRVKGEGVRGEKRQRERERGNS